MDASQVYVIVAIVVLAAIFATLLLLGRGERGRRLTPLAGLAFACVLAGLLFGDEPWLGYSLLGAGMVLAAVDIARRRKRPS